MEFLQPTILHLKNVCIPIQILHNWIPLKVDIGSNMTQDLLLYMLVHAFAFKSNLVANSEFQIH